MPAHSGPLLTSHPPSTCWPKEPHCQVQSQGEEYFPVTQRPWHGGRCGILVQGSEETRGSVTRKRPGAAGSAQILLWQQEQKGSFFLEKSQKRLQYGCGLNSCLCSQPQTDGDLQSLKLPVPGGCHHLGPPREGAWPVVGVAPVASAQVPLEGGGSPGHTHVLRNLGNGVEPEGAGRGAQLGGQLQPQPRLRISSSVLLASAHRGRRSPLCAQVVSGLVLCGGSSRLLRAS